jgi:hypothetical protein
MAMRGSGTRLVGIVLAWAGLALACAPATAAATSRRVEIRVTPGTSGPIRLHVRARSGSSVRAALNGHDLGRFGPSRHGVRRLRVSPTYGLRFGTNILKLRRREPGERRAQRLRVQFRIPRTHPLADAGYDRKVTVGEPILLDGSRSVSHLAPQGATASAAAGRRSGLRFRWRVLRAPRGSRLRRHRRARSAHAPDAIPPVSGSAADLDNADSSAADLTPDEPGTYTVQLAATATDGTTGLDQTEVTVVNPPMVAIETMARFAGRPSPGPPPPAPTTDQTTTASTTDQSTTTTTDQTTTAAPTDTAPTPPPAPTAPPDPGPTTPVSSPCPFETTSAGIADGTPGVRIGSMFCPGDATKWLQLVVLDRRTLQPKSNTLYDCPNTSRQFVVDTGCTAKVRADIGRLDDSNLVIAVSQPPTASVPPCNPSCDDRWGVQRSNGFDESLAGIGVDLPFGGGNLRGVVSAIGVPGGQKGSATQHAELNTSTPASNGDIAGGLIKNTDGNYTFIAPKVTYETQAEGSTSDQNAIRVGGATYTASIKPTADAARQNAQGGFQVLVLDPKSLQPQVDPKNPFAAGTSYWFPTGQQDFDSGEPNRLQKMADVLQQANASERIVILASRGNAAAQGAGQSTQWEAVSKAAKNVVDQIEALGGTRTAAFQALAGGVPNAGASYTLVGWGGAGTARGIESQGQGATPAQGLNTASLRGSLKRRNDYRFEVAPDSSPDAPTAGTRHVPAELLDDTLTQPSTPWPDATNAAQQAAITYIGKVRFGGQDIRTKFWSDYYPDAAFDDAWNQVKSAVDAVPYPLGDTKQFTRVDLDDAKTELDTEITWLKNVHALVVTLAQPFNADTKIQAWADLNALSAKIDSSVNEAATIANNKPAAIMQAVLNGAREAAVGIPGIGEGIGVVNAVFDTALEISTIGNETPADEPFSVESSQVFEELLARINKAHDALTTQVFRAIVSDYGKLRRVGACASPVPDNNCPEDPAAWKLTPEEVTSASEAIRVGTEVEDYAALVPAKWTLWQLADSCPGSAGYTCSENHFQGDGFGEPVLGSTYYCPFTYEAATATLVRPLYRDIPFYRNPPGVTTGAPPNDNWQAFALGNLTGHGDQLYGRWTMEVPKDFLARLFAAPGKGGSADPSGGNLGVKPEQFFLRNFTPKLIGNGGQGYPTTAPIASYPVWNGRTPSCTP